VSRPTSTSTPDYDLSLIFDEGWPERLVLEHYTGEWSPTANEPAGPHIWEAGEEGVRITDFDSAEFVSIATAPGFILRPVQIGNSSFFESDFTWTPDGRQLVLGVFNMGDSILWKVSRSSENPAVVVPTGAPGYHTYELMKFIGWADPCTLLVTGYSGGGHFFFTKVDYLSGKVLATGLVLGELFPPNTSFIHAIEYRGTPS